MPVRLRREALVLFIGDMCALVFSLWATLLVRSAAFPSWDVFYTHLVPFSFLFLLSVAVFLIAGLYERHTLIVRSKLPQTVFYAQLANIAVAAIFFFSVPYFGIQPKTNLFIYLFLSTTLVSAWRLYFLPLFSVSAPAPALLVGEGPECRDVMNEVNNHTRYTIRFSDFCDLAGREPEAAQQAVLAAVKKHRASVVVLPFSFLRRSSLSTTWDALMLSGVEFIDLENLYEDLFGRVALPLLDQGWFVDVQARTPTVIYDFFKRVADVALSALALTVLSPLLLVVTLVLAAGDGPPFIFQKRLGKDNRDIRIVKFRTMLFDDGEDPEKKKQNRITPFGAFLRKTQIDEMPQFWNVLRGDLSLIGPRPEIPRFVEEYAHLIPFYETRHLIQPGLSGWAQIKHASPPKLKLDVEATKNKLSYDLYYLKRRSFLLDMEIVLRTVKILLSWASR